MLKWLGDILKGAISTLVAAAAVALPGYLAWAQQMPWFLIPLSILFSAGIILFVVNQWRLWKKGRGISRLSDNKIEKMAREWIDIPGVPIEKKPPEESILFNYLATFRSGANIFVNVVRDARNPAVIQLVARVKTSLEDVPFDDQAMLKNSGRVGIEMARLGIGYKFDGSPNKRSFVSVYDNVILDNSLTEFYFRQRVMFVLRAAILVCETTQQTAYELGLHPTLEK